MTKIFTPRSELIDQLVERDGLICRYPDHTHALDLEAEEGPAQVTIDHWMPQTWCRENGWTTEQIWELSNLSLMCKKGNAAKGDRVPDENGILPARPLNRFRYRRQKRAERPEVCTSCNAGRNLQEGEFCRSCNSGPQPERFPRWRQMSTKDCDHDLFYCVACLVWFPEKRRSVLDTLIVGGPEYDDRDE